MKSKRVGGLLFLGLIATLGACSEKKARVKESEKEMRERIRKEEASKLKENLIRSQERFKLVHKADAKWVKNAESLEKAACACKDKKCAVRQALRISSFFKEIKNVRIHDSFAKQLVDSLARATSCGRKLGAHVKFPRSEPPKLSFGNQAVIDRFKVKLKECASEVFTHKKFPYKPPKGAASDGYKKATGVVVKEIRICLQAQKTADGKGISPPNMKSSQVEPLAAAKTCKEFADKFVSLLACETRIEALIDDAGFIDPEDADDDAVIKK